MGACGACHASKVKCDKGQPACGRCLRLKIPCIPHRSRQGRGIKRRRKSQESIVENAFLQSSHEFSVPGKAADHYGLHHMLHQWISIAFSRRSFRLLNMASSLAMKNGIPMDHIICGNGEVSKRWEGNEGQTRMDFLSGTVAKSLEEQQKEVSVIPLTLEEIPHEIFVTMRCIRSVETIDGTNREQIDLESRWIFIREFNCGKNRFFVSPKFSKDVQPLSIIERTWEENKVEVKSLFLPLPSERKRLSQSLVNQVSQNQFPSMFPDPDRIVDTILRLRSDKEVRVDLLNCYRMVNLDKAFMYMEFIPLKKMSSAPRNIASFDIGKNAATTALLENSLDDKFDDERLFSDMPAFEGLIDESDWHMALSEIID
eukprot:CAMPEP_0194370190 /NCGR_PEP_ID=MMETSP0174-20130528/18477_1 /TAXON_ID=216777 /ORGANISM="Proboscia alata, Strain PI-D3" /LENGTH=370 /DNA_ID=CAMNT_0039147495 /DNA_START=153 /DNA_END=1265 /DNA_ORIENTATION=-